MNAAKVRIAKALGYVRLEGEWVKDTRLDNPQRHSYEPNCGTNPGLGCWWCGKPKDAHQKATERVEDGSA